MKLILIEYYFVFGTSFGDLGIFKYNYLTGDIYSFNDKKSIPEHEGGISSIDIISGPNKLVASAGFDNKLKVN